MDTDTKMPSILELKEEEEQNKPASVAGGGAFSGWMKIKREGTEASELLEEDFR